MTIIYNIVILYTRGRGRPNKTTYDPKNKRCVNMKKIEITVGKDVKDIRKTEDGIVLVVEKPTEVKAKVKDPKREKIEDLFY